MKLLNQFDRTTQRSPISTLTLLTLCISAAILTTQTVAQDDAVLINQELWETVIYEGNVQNDKSYGYYMMTISERYYDGKQSLAIKVVPEQYDSDPDLFISINNTQPTSSQDSQWFCTKQGGDTCVLNKGTFSQGDTLYIGVRCINPCQYTIASNYIQEIKINDANRTQVRLDGFSSNVFNYSIPSVNPSGITRAVTITVHSEDEYTPIDLYLSLDNQIYQIEERKVENILEEGVGFMFTENDFGWCTNCNIWVLADVYADGRYYVTFTSHSRSNTIDTTPSDQIINPRQQECVLYFTLAAENDVMLYSSQYQGDTDLYISGSTRPNDYQDSRILQQGLRFPHKCLIITAEDRTRWGFRTGVMNVCHYGYIMSTVQISPLEDNYGGLYDARDGVSYMLNLEKNSSQYFRYTNSKFIYAGNMTVTLTSYNLSSGQAPPRLQYKVCKSTDSGACTLNNTEQRGQGMIEVASGAGNITNGNTRIATIVHNRTLCPDPRQCYYLINLFFPDQNGPMKTSFMLTYNSTAFQRVNLDQKFKNILKQGQYFYYALMPNSSDGFAFMQSLQIKIDSNLGDADLVVSVVDQNPEMDQNQFEARGTDTYDSIVLNNTGNFSLNRAIYIGVYAQTFCVYEISFDPVYKVEYNVKLVKAVPMTDQIAYPNLYKTELEESFYSFRPWWAGYENRTIVFFAQVTFNNIFFYLEANDYPQFYMTEYRDKNDTIVLYPGDDQYSLYNTYFIRVRPDFQLQDLISSRDYIFNFFAFSQLPSTQIVDIHLNERSLGYANASSVFYQHFIIENTATYNFSVIPIIGDPAILLKLSNTPIYPVSADVQSWDYKTDNEGKVTDSIIVTFNDRSSRYAFCDNAGFNLNGGNRSCGFYLAVECKSECIFNITVQIQGRENQTLPKFLIEDGYYTGQVGYNQTSYFYYPLSRNTGEMVIILNKTGAIGNNGDSMILVNLMSESVSRPLQQWSYPRVGNYTFGSANYKATQPEIIEICSGTIAARCSDSSCILMIGVVGNTPNKISNFRLMILKQENKLFDSRPIQDTIATAGEYNFYWFASNVSAINPNTPWEYQIITSANQDGKDVDLYVSALDGRFPVTEDYDFSSENLGADSVYINSQSSFFDEAGYNKSNGILFVVGVKAITPNTSYTLMITGPNKTSITITNLTAGQQVTRGLQGNVATNRTNYFKWFNWGQKDFRINIDVTQGNVSAFINFVGEEVFINNGFLGLPVNNNNSRWVVYLNASQSGVLQVPKTDNSTNRLFCYFCWYYITVTTNLTGTTSYRISVNEVPDVGEEVPLVSLNTSVGLTLPATGTVQTRKFILDTKDPFVISATVTSGYLIMYVGLYPESPKSRYQFYAEGDSKREVRISVRQTDQNFKVGAFYYITCQSGSGRTSFTFSINQRKTVSQLENGVVYKDQYWNMDERIKLYYFQAPNSRVNLFRAAINIQALTPGFYPIVLLNRLSLTSTPTDFTKLTYPNMKTFNISFGDNFFSIANQKNVNLFINSHQHHQFTYQIRDVGGNNTYYTIALYSFSYGMTDKRKAQFKISLTIDNKTLQSANFYEFEKYYSLNYHNGKDLSLPGYFSNGIYDDYEFESELNALEVKKDNVIAQKKSFETFTEIPIQEAEHMRNYNDPFQEQAVDNNKQHSSHMNDLFSGTFKKVGGQIEEYFARNHKQTINFISLQE